MNPYLRLVQPGRPSTYLYATNTMESPWPEMEPVSSTQPPVRAEILKEWPLGETATSTRLLSGTALAIMGVFLGDDLVFTLWAQKYLGIDENKVFVWNERHGSTQDLGIPVSTYNRSGPNIITIRPAVIPSKGFDRNVTTSIIGNSQLHDDIDEAIETAYANWKPRPPADLQRASDDISHVLIPLRPPKGKLSQGYHWVTSCPDVHQSSNERVVIAYAIWVWPEPMFGWGKATPIFSVLNLERPENWEDRIYTSAAMAVSAALGSCEIYDSTKVENLTTEISSHVDEEMAKYRKVE